MLCVVIKGPKIEDIYDQIQEAVALCDCIELRLDLFVDVTLEQIKKIRLDFPIPMLFTLRSSGKEREERLLQLQHVAELKPDYLDLEYPEDVPFALQLQGIKIILSYHDFDKTPSDLQGLYEKMSTTPAHFYKIALKANSTLDVMHLLCWSKPQACIVISMGTYGHISRILSPVIGNPITYACLKEDPSSPLGQLCAKRLVDQYDFYALTPQTALYGLIGDPVTQSISDLTHNTYFQNGGIDAVYVKIPVSSVELGAVLKLSKQLPFKGLSVTMPLKEAVMPHLDAIDEEAQAQRAVNTLLLQEGKWIGYNTDGKGALNALEKRNTLANKHLVILGAGGAARAIAYEAHKRGACITILNRHVERAEAIATICRGTAQALTQIPEHYDILINCTPADMPMDPQHLLPQALVMDIRTRPKETALLKAALEKGSSIVYGYEMFIEQALLQFELWGLSSSSCQTFHTVVYQEILMLESPH